MPAAFGVVHALLTLSVAIAQQHLNWHGVFDERGNVVDEGVLLRVWSNRTETGEHMVLPCSYSYPSLHLFALGGTKVAAAGCATTCTNANCAPDGVPIGETFASVWLSEDAGLHWSRPRPDEHNSSLLLRAGSAAVTLPPAGKGTPLLHCIIGGFPINAALDGPRFGDAASGKVVCSRDGVSWARQSVELPSPRASASPLVFQLPGEQHFRIFLFGGLASHTVTTERESVANSEWILMSDPIDLTRLPSEGTVPVDIVAGWAHVQGYPDQLQDRLYPIALHWPACEGDAEDSDYCTVVEQEGDLARPDAIMVGLGIDTTATATGEFANDLYWTADIRNMSAWRRLPIDTSALFYNTPLSSVIAPWPSVTLLGGSQVASTLGPGKNDRRPRAVAVTFTDDRRAFALAPVSTSPALLLHTTMSSSDPSYADRSEYITTVAGSSPVTSIVDARGPDDQIILVALFINGIMRAFTESCNHTCPVGSFALHCGVHPRDVHCAACDSCTGAAGVGPDGIPTTVLDADTIENNCRTGPRRNQNRNAVCEPCSSTCTGSEVVLRKCTPTVDTICGPKPQFLSSSLRMQEIHHTGVVLLLSVAGTVLLLLVAGACFSFNATRHASRRSAITWSTSEVQVSGTGKDTSNTAAVVDSPLSGNVQAPHSSLPSPTLEYATLKGQSMQRTAARTASAALASKLLVVADCALALLAHWSVLSLCWSLLHPDEVPGDSLLPDGYALPFVAGANALLAVTACTVALNTIFLAWNGAAWKKSAYFVALTPLLPWHSRLATDLVLQARASAKLSLSARSVVIISLWSPVSLFLYDLPSLMLVGNILSASGYPREAWLAGSSSSLELLMSTPVPKEAQAAWTLLLLNTGWSACNLVSRIVVCTRNGGLYRLRRAVLSLPEFLWLVTLVVPQATIRLPEQGEVVQPLPNTDTGAAGAVHAKTPVDVFTS